jgi:hypothetical protein
VTRAITKRLAHALPRRLRMSASSNSWLDEEDLDPRDLSARYDLVAEIVESRVLVTPRVVAAFREVPREAFVPRISRGTPTRTRRSRSVSIRRSRNRPSSPS